MRLVSYEFFLFVFSIKIFVSFFLAFKNSNLHRLKRFVLSFEMAFIFIFF